MNSNNFSLQTTIWCFEWYLFCYIDFWTPKRSNWGAFVYWLFKSQLKPALLLKGNKFPSVLLPIPQILKNSPKTWHCVWKLSSMETIISTFKPHCSVSWQKFVHACVSGRVGTENIVTCKHKVLKGNRLYQDKKCSKHSIVQPWNFMYFCWASNFDS
jgi:hypothetical protein